MELLGPLMRGGSAIFSSILLVAVKDTNIYGLMLELHLQICNGDKGKNIRAVTRLAWAGVGDGHISLV